MNKSTKILGVFSVYLMSSTAMAAGTLAQLASQDDSAGAYAAVSLDVDPFAGIEAPVATTEGAGDALLDTSPKAAAPQLDAAAAIANIVPAGPGAPASTADATAAFTGLAASPTPASAPSPDDIAVDAFTASAPDSFAATGVSDALLAADVASAMGNGANAPAAAGALASAVGYAVSAPAAAAGAVVAGASRAMETLRGAPAAASALATGASNFLGASVDGITSFGLASLFGGGSASAVAPAAAAPSEATVPETAATVAATASATAPAPVPDVPEVPKTRLVEGPGGVFTVNVGEIKSVPVEISLAPEAFITALAAKGQRLLTLTATVQVDEFMAVILDTPLALRTLLETLAAEGKVPLKPEATVQANFKAMYAALEMTREKVVHEEAVERSAAEYVRPPLEMAPLFDLPNGKDATEHRYLSDDTLPIDVLISTQRFVSLLGGKSRTLGSEKSLQIFDPKQSLQVNVRKLYEALCREMDIYNKKAAPDSSAASPRDAAAAGAGALGSAPAAEEDLLSGVPAAAGAGAVASKASADTEVPIRDPKSDRIVGFNHDGKLETRTVHVKTLGLVQSLLVQWMREKLIPVNLAASAEENLIAMCKAYSIYVSRLARAEKDGSPLIPGALDLEGIFDALPKGTDKEDRTLSPGVRVATVKPLENVMNEYALVVPIFNEGVGVARNMDALYKALCHVKGCYEKKLATSALSGSGSGSGSVAATAVDRSEPTHVVTPSDTVFERELVRLYRPVSPLEEAIRAKIESAKDAARPAITPYMTHLVETYKPTDWVVPSSDVIMSDDPAVQLQMQLASATEAALTRGEAPPFNMDGDAQEWVRSEAGKLTSVATLTHLQALVKKWQVEGPVLTNEEAGVMGTFKGLVWLFGALEAELARADAMGDIAHDLAPIAAADYLMEAAPDKAQKIRDGFPPVPTVAPLRALIKDLEGALPFLNSKASVEANMLALYKATCHAARRYESRPAELEAKRKADAAALEAQQRADAAALEAQQRADAAALEAKTKADAAALEAQETNGTYAPPAVPDAAGAGAPKGKGRGTFARVIAGAEAAAEKADAAAGSGEKGATELPVWADVPVGAPAPAPSAAPASPPTPARQGSWLGALAGAFRGGSASAVAATAKGAATPSPVATGGAGAVPTATGAVPTATGAVPAATGAVTDAMSDDDSSGAEEDSSDEEGAAAAATRAGDGYSDGKAATAGKHV